MILKMTSGFFMLLHQITHVKIRIERELLIQKHKKTISAILRFTRYFTDDLIVSGKNVKFDKKVILKFC